MSNLIRICLIFFICTKIVILQHHGPSPDEVNKSQVYKAEETNDEKTKTSEFGMEWEKKMSDYDSYYFYIIPLGYKTKEVFYENITTVPARLRGAYIVDEEGENKIEFKIRSYNSKVVFSKEASHCIFDFNVTDEGYYIIEMYNKFINKELKVTYTMSTGQNIILKKDDFNETERKLDRLGSFIKRFNLEFKMGRNIHQERYKKILNTNKYFYIFSVTETIMLIAISLWQFYYMRHLFEIKGTL